LLETLALEAETIINNLGITKQYYKHAVAKNVKKMHQESNKNNIRKKKKRKIITDIKNKILTNKLTIIKAGNGKTVVILTKRTQTDIIIPNNSCHPHQQKILSINYLLNRLQTYPITEETKEK
jgi:hypothetical protein